MQKLSLIILLLLTAGLSCMAAEDWFTGFQEEMPYRLAKALKNGGQRWIRTIELGESGFTVRRV